MSGGNGAKKDYAFNGKNKWRKKQWEFLSRNVPDKKNATGLVLTGRRGFDLWHMKYLGFSLDNLTVVERDESTAKSIRKMGVRCVCSSLNSVIEAWTSGPQISYMVADTCGGISNETKGLALWIAMGLWSTDREDSWLDKRFTFCGNFLRGRDREDPAHALARMASAGRRSKHRGKRFFDELALMVMAWSPEGLDGLVPPGPKGTKRRKPREFLLRAKPAYESYRSGKNVMDSAFLALRAWDNPYKIHLSGDEPGASKKERAEYTRTRTRLAAARAAYTRQHNV